MDRAGDEVYTGVTAMVKQVVQLKNDITTLPSSEYPTSVKVGPAPPRWGCDQSESLSKVFEKFYLLQWIHHYKNWGIWQGLNMIPWFLCSFLRFWSPKDSKLMYVTEQEGALLHHSKLSSIWLLFVVMAWMWFMWGKQCYIAFYIASFPTLNLALHLSGFQPSMNVLGSKYVQRMTERGFPMMTIT